MVKIDCIKYDESLIIRIIANIMHKTPGVNGDEILNVVISNKHDAVDVTFTPLKNISNVYNLAQKIQNAIYYQLVKIFDLNDIVVNVTVKKGRE